MVTLTENETAATVLSKTVAAIQAAASDVTVSTSGLSLTVTSNATGAVAAPGQNFGGINNVNFSPVQVTAGTDSTINAATDRLTIQSHGYTTGQTITLASNGTLPGGLSSASTYYAIIVDANTIKLATLAL